MTNPQVGDAISSEASQDAVVANVVRWTAQIGSAGLNSYAVQRTMKKERSFYFLMIILG